MTAMLIHALMISFLPAVIKAAKKAVPWPGGQPTLPTQHGWKVSATGPGAWIPLPLSTYRFFQKVATCLLSWKPETFKCFPLSKYSQRLMYRSFPGTLKWPLALHRGSDSSPLSPAPQPTPFFPGTDRLHCMMGR